MCENGVNVDQMRISLEQSQTTLGLVGGWLGDSAHRLGHASRDDVAGSLAEARKLVDEAAAIVASAITDLDAQPAGSVTVERV